MWLCGQCTHGWAPIRTHTHTLHTSFPCFDALMTLILTTPIERGVHRARCACFHLCLTPFADADVAASDPNWTPFPTYPVALMFKGDDADLNDFKKRVGGSTAKGLPKFDPNRGVRPRHWLQPLPSFIYQRRERTWLMTRNRRCMERRALRF